MYRVKEDGLQKARHGSKAARMVPTVRSIVATTPCRKIRDDPLSSPFGLNWETDNGG
jgi:hypothetical protein